MNIREFILGRLLTIITNVGNLLVEVDALLNITEFTLERDPTNVVNVETSTSFSI